MGVGAANASPRARDWLSRFISTGKGILLNMRNPETEEHSKLKDILKNKLTEWFKGIVLKEYMVAGFEADVYGVTQDNRIIHGEIIWSPGQYEKNIVSLLISDAHLKIAVFGPESLKKFEREYDKVRIEQSKKGFFFSSPIDGNRLLQKDEPYLESFHEEIVRLTTGLPKIVSTFPRSYWYVNEELVRVVSEILSEKKWQSYPALNQISLLEENCTKDLEDVGHETVGFFTNDMETVYVDSLTWSESKKILRFFGRFNTPFGVREETVSQFLLDPCYFRFKRPYSLNIHIKPDYIRSELESNEPLGLDRWQKPSIFVLGLLKRLEPWQPLMIEPLAIYTSEEESHDFHQLLIRKTGRLERLRTYFDDLDEKYGMEKAEKLEEIIDKELEKVLLENCWQNQKKARDLENLYGIVTQLIVEKNEADALYRIVSYSFAYNSKEKAERQFQKAKSYLVVLKDIYPHIIGSMLKELNPAFDLEHLLTREMAFYDLAIKILEKGKVTIEGEPRTDGFFVKVNVHLKLEEKSRNFVLRIPDDYLSSLKEISKEHTKT